MQMQLFMDANGFKYTAFSAKSGADCLLPFGSPEIFAILEAARTPLRDEIIAESIENLKNLSTTDREEFDANLQEIRNAYPPAP